MKTFYLNFEDGLDKQYISWAKEAVQEFINLFPEYKDNFAIKKDNFSYANEDVLKTIAEKNKELYHRRGKVFDEASFWRMFDRLPDGSYKASLQKQISLASRSGIIDIQKLSSLQADSMGNEYSASSPILINIIKQKAGGNIRGISSEVSVNISAGTCADLGYKGADLKAYFKDIIIHELGHTFNATHEGRQNAVENLGMHCTDKNCLMYEYAYTDESFNRRKKLKEPFCSDCMASMRDYMQNELHFSKTKTNQPQAVDIRNLPMFKDMTPAELKTLHNYQRILREKNIQRSAQNQLFDMMSIFASARGGHNMSFPSNDNIIGEDKFLEATARTDWSDASALKNLQGKIYSYKRYIAYTPPFSLDDMETPTPEVKKIENAQMAQGKLAQVKDEGYWIRKYGQGYFDNIKADPNKEKHRFILNVNPSEDLFQKLDDFADKYGCQYKFPHLLSWNQRIDTVIVYTSDDRITEQQNELIKIASPHIRRERMTNGLDGTRLADGIFMAKEVDKSDIMALAQKAEQNLPQLAQKLREVTQDSRAHPLSLGEFLSYKEIIDNTNQAATVSYNTKLPQIDFANGGRRGAHMIYNELKNNKPALANQLDMLVDKYQKNNDTDWSALDKDAEYQRIVGEFKKNTPVSKNPTYLDDVNLFEADFLKSYDDYLQTNQIKRRDDDIFLDKMYLLAQMRRDYNNSNAYSDRFTQAGKYNFASITQTDWSKPTSFKALRIAVYEAKKNVKYDTDLFDKTKPPTKNPDGSIPPYAVGGQTPKGDELAKVLIDDKKMEVKADLLSEQWIYRLPPNRGKDDFVKKPIVERFAINALPDKDLIQKLDDFAKKYHVYYKTATPTKWHQRNDSVVIYCPSKQTPEMINELKTIVKPYIRKEKPGRTNDLDGTLIADGLVSAQEPNKDNLKALFDEIKTVNPQMAISLKNEIAEHLAAHPDNPLSLGQAEAYREMLKSYRNFKGIPEQKEKITVNNEPLKEEHQGTDRTFKKALREVFEPSARKEGSVYKEDIRANNYVAKITHKDGSVDHISASSATNLSLSGQDKDGNPRIPDMQRFRDIAEYTHRKNTFVNFGDIKTPEFKAKLMLACMEHEPPVAMRGQPKVNKEFLDSLTNTAVKKMLEDAINKDKKTKPQQQATVISQNILQGGR